MGDEDDLALAAALLEAFSRALALVQSPGKRSSKVAQLTLSFSWPSQTKFACRWCGNATHTDVNASRVVNQRWSLGLGTEWHTKGAIRAVLVSQHIKRWPLIRSNGPQGATHDPRLSNPYFKGWEDLARNALETQGAGACPGKQQIPRYESGCVHYARFSNAEAF
jgi:hypothetical protein